MSTSRGVEMYNDLKTMNSNEGLGGDMVNGDIWHEIHSRFKLEEAKRSIARALGLSIQTGREVLRQEEPKRYKRRPAQGSILKAFESPEHLNNVLQAWISTMADQKIHGTTHRRPQELFEEKRGLLMDHSQKPNYAIQQLAFRQVAKGCLVTFEANRYSAP